MIPSEERSERGLSLDPTIEDQQSTGNHVDIPVDTLQLASARLERALCPGARVHVCQPPPASPDTLHAADAAPQLLDIQQPMISTEVTCALHRLAPVPERSHKLWPVTGCCGSLLPAVISRPLPPPCVARKVAGVLVSCRLQRHLYCLRKETRHNEAVMQGCAHLKLGIALHSHRKICPPPPLHKSLHSGPPFRSGTQPASYHMTPQPSICLPARPPTYPPTHPLAVWLRIQRQPRAQKVGPPELRKGGPALFIPARVAHKGSQAAEKVIPHACGVGGELP